MDEPIDRRTGCQMILAIDPGAEQSGWIVVAEEPFAVLDKGTEDNYDLMERVQNHLGPAWGRLVIEMVESYGMPVGRDVFRTVLWIGRFIQVWGDDSTVSEITRREVKLSLCGSSRAKDAAAARWVGLSRSRRPMAANSG